ncbi:MAG: FxDxF family PEP-CTERM protein [Pseudomonadota bacterium]|jgi:hypothetical protein
MLRTKALLGLMLAGFAGSAAAAGPGYLGNLSGQSFSIGNSFAPLSTIYDIYTFDILPFSAVAGTAVTVNLDIPLFAGTEFAISNFGVEFRDAANTLIASNFQTSATDYTVEIVADLVAGTGYQFIVLGDVTGTLGGSYGGALAAAPIPEAESYLMMLAGLGLVGFMVLRRRAA